MQKTVGVQHGMLSEALHASYEMSSKRNIKKILNKSRCQICRKKSSFVKNVV